MSSDARFEEPPAPSFRGELRLIKAAIVVLGLAVCLVGRRVSTWPVATWGMYSTWTPKLPPTRTSIIELRVVSARGDTQTVSSADLFSEERHELGDSFFEHAFDDVQSAHRDADRVYIARLLDLRAADVEAREIQGWRVSWEVRPLELPPLHRDQPAELRLLGSFVPPSRRQD